MPVSDTRKGRDLTFFWNDSKIGFLKSFSLSVDGNQIDASTDDSGNWDEFIAGRKNWTMSLTCNIDEHVSGSTTIQANVISDFIDSNTSGSAKFGPEVSGSGDIVYSGDAYVSNFSIDRGDSDDVIESSFELQGTGPLTRSEVA